MQPPTSVACEVTIQPLGRVVTSVDGQTVWEAARAGGVVLPVSCRNGTCRTCMCRCVSGRVAYRIPWPGLSAEEKAEGWVLPCVAVPQGALTVDVPFARLADHQETP